MKKVYTILFFIFFNFCFSQNLKGLNIKSIDSIVFYDFNKDLKDEYLSIIDRNGKLNLNIISKSFRLEETDFKAFIKILNKKDSYGEATASCFDPHLGIVFFSKGIPKNYINICFNCNGLRANFIITAQQQGKHGKGKDSYYTLDGMSEKIRKYLKRLITRHNFDN